MQERGVRTHLKTVPGRPVDTARFTPEKFLYDEQADRYTCPAGQTLYPRRYHERRQATEYVARQGVCAACALRPHCTDSPNGRHLTRHRLHDLVLLARTQATSPEARRDYRRHRHLMEGSFAQSANCHGFKRSRWRRLRRQQIQDWLIAACQNVKILTRALRPGPLASEHRLSAAPGRSHDSIWRSLHSCSVEIVHLFAPRAFPLAQLD
jgi:hypothetical protein